MRNSFLIEEIKMGYPEYIEQLQELLDQKDKNVTYYYHGAQGLDDAENIINKGLYMQYNEIERTAKANLSLAQILNYSYGYDNVGRHAVVVIAVPNGENIVARNPDKNISVSGTSQGLKQGAFNPEYVIHNQYIVGYINKDEKKIIKNPNYIYDGELKNDFYWFCDAVQNWEYNRTNPWNYKYKMSYGLMVKNYQDKIIERANKAVYASKIARTSPIFRPIKRMLLNWSSRQH